MNQQDRQLNRIADDIELEGNRLNSDVLRVAAASIRNCCNRKPPEGTVRVRTAAAISETGTWAIAPDCDDDRGLMEDAVNRLLSSADPRVKTAVHFVEFDLPMPPIPTTIPAEVQHAEG